MSERPEDQQPGYPPAPTPRGEPYSVDEPTDRASGAATPEEASGASTQPLAWSNPQPAEDRDPQQADAGWSRQAPGAGWSTQPGEPGSRSYGDPHSTSSPAQYPSSSQPAQSATAGGSAAAPAAASWAWQDAGSDPQQSPAGPHGADDGAAPVDRPGDRRGRRGVATGVVVLLVLVALLGGIVLGALGARELFPATSGALPSQSAQAPVDRPDDSIAGIANDALESTVFIEVIGGGVAGSGSGMVLREDGYLVTNNHVIAPAAEGDGQLAVTFADGSQEPAEIVGSTPDYDLAVLQVDRAGLTPLPLADSDAVVVGDTAIAVGAPLGLEGTVTSGIISALNRPVAAGQGGSASFINAIQTDAAINPGNSGGPLISGAGEVIGINTAIAQAAGQQTGSIGLGFAIPANQVRRTAAQIIETGQATYPVIGVALDTAYQGEGVRVVEDGLADTPAVTPDGPGETAGIEPGDIITEFDGQPVTSPEELIVAVRSRAPGDTVVLTVRSDGGEEREVEVVLDEAVSD